MLSADKTNKAFVVPQNSSPKMLTNPRIVLINWAEDKDVAQVQAAVTKLLTLDHITSALAEHGIGSAVHYPMPLHLQPAFARYATGRFPRAERACREILSLPLWPHMPDSAVLAVAGHIREFFANAK